jgi:hypothetical protein
MEARLNEAKPVDDEIFCYLRIPTEPVAFVVDTGSGDDYDEIAIIRIHMTSTFLDPHRVVIPDFLFIEPSEIVLTREIRNTSSMGLKM